MAEKKTSKASSAKRTDGAHRTVTPTPELAAVIGADPLTRNDAVKKIWNYIKAHKLQDPKDGRQINADDKLAPVLGKTPISMFEMNRKLFAHLKAE
jgi:chromatin remodeling complex protein RSC6